MSATPEVWWGHVTSARFNDDTDPWKGGWFVVADPRWPQLPPIGTAVEVRFVDRSPYWSLVEED